MKRIILTLTIAATVSVAFAQKNKVVSAFNYNKAFARSGKCTELQKGVEAINLATEHESTKSWAKTWFYKGNLYYSAIQSQDPACKKLHVSILDQCTDAYLKTLSLNFDDPSLKKLDLSKEDGSDIPKFLEAGRNRSKMDNSEYTSKIVRLLPGLSGEYVNRGIEEYSAQNYVAAEKSFGKAVLLGKINERVDGVVMFNQALASENAKNFDKAKQIYDELIAMNYNKDDNGPNLYLAMSKIYKDEGNDAKATEYIINGRKAYPSHQNLILTETDLYLKSDKNEEALANLNTALTNDDQNAFLYYVRGTVYDKLKNEEKALADYSKAIEIDPKQKDALFNLGTFYFNKGADKVNAANDLPLSETKKYNALNAEAKESFTKSIPYMEKAHELDQSDIVTAETLIKAYTKTDQLEKASAIKAKYK